MIPGVLQKVQGQGVKGQGYSETKLEQKIAKL